MIKILKKDEQFFEKNMSHTTLTEYHKTKDNSLRIAIFADKSFIAIETPKSLGIFQDLVLNKDARFELKNKTTETKKDGTVDHIKYFGIINN